jgi:hypothetical protein
MAARVTLKSRNFDLVTLTRESPLPACAGAADGGLLAIAKLAPEIGAGRAA